MPTATKKRRSQKPPQVQAAPAAKPPLRLEWIDADSLDENPANWRKHPQQQLDALSSVIGDVGWAGALLFNETTQRLIDGHGRKKISTGQKVPVLIGNWSEAEEKKILATLDPLAAMAEADAGALDALLREVETGDEAVAKMLQDLAKEAGCEWAKENGEIVEDEVPVPPVVPVTKPGDLWLLGDEKTGHRLLCGDSTDESNVRRVMNSEFADCIVTSPPYAVGVDYGEYQDTIDNLRTMLPKLASLWHLVLPAGGFAVINFGDIASGKSVAGTDEVCEYPMAVEYWPIFRKEGWYLWSRRAWCKPNARVNSKQCIQSNRAATDWENVWTWKRPGRAFVEKSGGQFGSAFGWRDSGSLQGVDIGKETHGAGMPVGIAAWMINVHSRPKSLVFEPFGGTGTTLIAAEQLGRRCNAIELSPAYCDVICQRYETITGKKAVLAEKGGAGP